ncbi:hypothetical protein QQZ08_007255 [Neonectria magnoliae]|uniref:Uncharacterized protein n=1 Tax=Neonectria magnoliae TaxID=2732573 RepID=A0ABR1I030_9HYPO
MSTSPARYQALAAISRWAISPDPIGFGHLRVSHRDFVHAGVWSLISERLDNTCGQIVFVGSLLQKDLGVKAGLGRRDADAVPIIRTYTGFLSLLEENRAKDGNEPGAWKEAVQPQGRISDKILPCRVVVVFAVEPNMPALCALGLATTVHWAMAVSQRPGAHVRVLTLSPEDQAPATRRLLKLYSAPESTPFDMSDDEEPPTECRTVYTSHRSVDMTARILHSIVTNANAKHIILCFLSPLQIPSLLPAMQANFRDARSLVVYLLTRDSTEKHIKTALSCSRLYHIVYVDPWFRAPVQVQGFDHVHLAIATRETKNVYDAVMGQMAYLELPLSRDERLEQASWASRTTTNPKNITMYLDNNESIWEFIEAGHERRRLEVSNRQLGGFLGALGGLSHWYMNSTEIVNCFVPERFASLEISARMKRHGILVSAPSASIDNFTLGFPPNEAAVFNAVLPALDYDHRLACLVARKSSTQANSILQKIKIQLASLLCVGLLDVVTIKVDPSRSIEDREAILGACWGHTRPMANKGVMWLVLGLWKCVAKEYKDFRLTNKPDIHQVLIDVPGTACTVATVPSIQVARRIDAINAALGKAHEPYADEMDVLTDSEQLELQGDLLHAYFQQLVAMQLRGRGLHCHDLSNGQPFTNIRPWISALVDFDEIKQKEARPELVFGIYHAVERKADGVQFIDWTWIPTTLVANAAPEDIHEWLGCYPRPERNFEDPGEWWV